QHTAATTGYLLLERGLHHGAVGVVRQQRRERALTAYDCEIDYASYVRFRQETQKVDPACGHACISRKRDHGDIARPRDLPDSADRLRKQWPNNDLRAFGNGLLSRRLRTLQRAAIILHKQLNVRTLEFSERHFSRVPHRLGGDTCIALSGQWQDHRDTNLAVSDRSNGHLVGRLWRGAVSANLAGTGRENHRCRANGQKRPHMAPRPRRCPLLTPPTRHGRSPRDSSVSVVTGIAEFVALNLRL